MAQITLNSGDAVEPTGREAINSMFTELYNLLTNVTAFKLTKLRIKKRVSSTASASSVTPNIDDYDAYVFTALAAGLTINAPGGTPDDQDAIDFDIKDNGTSRSITVNAAIVPLGIVIPSATTINKVLRMRMIYSAARTRWEMVAANTEA